MYFTFHLALFLIPSYYISFSFFWGGGGGCFCFFFSLFFFFFCGCGGGGGVFGLVFSFFRIFIIHTFYVFILSLCLISLRLFIFSFFAPYILLFLSLFLSFVFVIPFVC